MKGNRLTEARVAWKQNLIIYPADWCVAVALLCNLLILLGEPIRNNTIVSLGSRGLILSLLLFSAFQIFSVIKSKNAPNAYYVLALLEAVAIAAVLSGPMVIIAKLVKLICFFMLPAYMLLYKNVRNIKLLQNGIYLFNWLCTAFWTLLFFSSYSHIFYGEYSAIRLNELTLGYANPNQTAMLLMVSFIIAFSAYQRDIKKEYKVAYLLQCIWTLYMLWGTDSRTCIIIVGIILALWIMRLIPKLGKGFVSLIFFLPLIMAFLLLFGGEDVRNMLIMGEEFDTGRTYLFMEVLERLTVPSFIFGDFALWFGENLHNSYLSIFASSGIIGLIAYLCFFWRMLHSYFASIDRSSMPQMTAFLGVLGTIAHGGSEATFLTAGMVYGSMVGLLLVLTLKEKESQ